MQRFKQFLQNEAIDWTKEKDHEGYPQAIKHGGKLYHVYDRDAGTRNKDSANGKLKKGDAVKQYRHRSKGVDSRLWANKHGHYEVDD